MHFSYKKVSSNWYNEAFVRRPHYQADENRVDLCSCKEGDDCEENCVNRAMLIECSRKCSKGDKCKNQVRNNTTATSPSHHRHTPTHPPSPYTTPSARSHPFPPLSSPLSSVDSVSLSAPLQRLSRRQYARTSIIKTKDRGHGLIASAPIPAHSLILEYCGEVISLSECYNRLSTYQSTGVFDFYMFQLSSHTVIDAQLYGNSARFINHSCDANAYTQTWTVGAQQRVGIWAKRDIDVGEEITYNYNAQTFNARGEHNAAIQHCKCGSCNCSQFLGEKVKHSREQDKADGKKKKAKEEREGSEKGRS